jgi:hypothetical protein
VPVEAEVAWYRGDGLRWRELHEPHRVERWNITIDGSTVGFATLTESRVGQPPSQGCSDRVIGLALARSFDGPATQLCGGVSVGRSIVDHPDTIVFLFLY